jgi:hypothetical protein
MTADQSVYSEKMNTSFLSWQSLEPAELKMIEVDNTEIRLIYNNDSELDLEFKDEKQLDRFVTHLVFSIVNREAPEEVRWN